MASGTIEDTPRRDRYLSKDLTLKEKILFFRGKYFPERQLFLRSEGRVRFLTIGTNTQIAMASALAISLVWGSVTSYAYLVRDTVLENKNKTIHSMSADYQSLSTDFGTLEKEVERRAKLLEERQAFLEKMLGAEDVGTPIDAASPTPKAPEGLKETDKHPKTSFLNEFLGSKAVQAATINNSDRRSHLLARLKNTSLRQQKLVNKLLKDANARYAHIQSTLAPTKLSSDDLLDHFDGETSAMGGPYIPALGFEPIFDASDHLAFSDLISASQRLEMVTLVLDSFPVGKPAEKYYVSSKFGKRRDPLKKTWANHPGLDLAGWPGTAIYATAPGKVVHAGWYGPYGRMVEIEHGNGFKTRFGHMRKLRVKKGDTVEVGTRVGDMGKTGRVTGTHLHYEIWFDGKVRDPAPFMKAANDVLKIQGRHEKTSN